MQINSLGSEEGWETCVLLSSQIVHLERSLCFFRLYFGDNSHQRVKSKPQNQQTHLFRVRRAETSIFNKVYISALYHIPASEVSGVHVITPHDFGNTIALLEAPSSSRPVYGLTKHSW